MTAPNPWVELGRRYEHDSEAQFLIFVEQFVEAKILLQSGIVAKQRMALVAADNLAELLLHRHKARIRSLGMEGSSLNLPRLDRNDLRELERDFKSRTRLGRKGGGEGMASLMLEPLLDDLDEAIFRVAHAYRNRVYHADRHNPAVLPLLTSVYLTAVGRAFVRHQPSNVGHSETATTKKLDAFGYHPQKERPGGATFWPKKAAETIIGVQSEGLGISLNEASVALGADLRARAGWAEAMLDDLLSQGLPEERLAWSLWWGEFWDVAGVDPQVVRLDRELADDWSVTLRDGESSFEKSSRLHDERNTRIKELLEQFEGKFSLGDIQRLRRLAERLRTAKNLGTLFDRYQKLDGRMELVESRLTESAVGWDLARQAAEDEARGK